MSRTPNIGVVGIRYWTYPAYVMSKHLDQIIQGRQEVRIRIGVLRNALLFLKVASWQKTGTYFDNHLARMNARVLAWMILNNCRGLYSNTLNEANGHFTRFVNFLENMAPLPDLQKKWFFRKLSIPLNELDRQTAIDLRDFFTTLVRTSVKKRP